MTDIEKEALCIRIDELGQEVEAFKREKAYGELNKCLQCSNIDALLKSQADNTMLQEQLEYDRQTSRSRLEHIDQLKDENNKLRELVRDMGEYIYIGTAQDGQSLHDRTHELGIEVN